MIPLKPSFFDIFKMDKTGVIQISLISFPSNNTRDDWSKNQRKTQKAVLGSFVYCSSYLASGALLTIHKSSQYSFMRPSLIFDWFSRVNRLWKATDM